MASESFDLVVIGGGPGGYVAAIRAAQLGQKACVIEKRAALGGTCLNVGCIPSKALLQSSHHYEAARHEFGQHGIKVGSVELDLAQLMARKDKVVGELTKGIDGLLKKHKIVRKLGAGRIAGPGKVAVGDETLNAKAILIATGSDVTPLAGVAIDERRIVSSTGALALKRVPKALAVIGAGVIGLELGSVWRRLGSRVTVVEFLDRILPPFDAEIAKQAERLLTRQGLAFKLGHKVTAAQPGKDGVTLALEPVAGGAAQTLEAEIVLVAIGRKPYVEGLGLEAAGVKLTPKGFIEVDKHFQTSQPGIHAIGDVIGGAMLAHKAEDEGVAVAEILAGKPGHVNYDAIPNVVYTTPEIAAVGLNEEQLKAKAIAYKVGKFPFAANGRARANGDTDGFVKVLADGRTDKVLGVHILGPNAGDLIAEAVLAMEFGASAEDIARTCHAHPALGEALKEAALAADGRVLHL
jgi:dihydrolipoamide dehydrogenase